MDATTAGFSIFTILIVVVSILASVAIPLLIIWKVVLPIFKGRADKQQLFATGMPAQASIVSMTDTGTRINDSPMINFQVNVELPGRPVYQVAVQDIVPMLALGMLQPGRKFAARVDPMNPQRVAIDWTGQSAPAQVEHGGVARLLATGIAGQAQITQCETLPMQAPDGDSMWKFSVQIQIPDGRPVYSGVAGQRVPAGVLGRFGPGTVVPCKVDPQDPSQYVLDFWSWAGIPAPQAPQQQPFAPTPFGQPAAQQQQQGYGAPVAPPAGQGWQGQGQ